LGGALLYKDLCGLPGNPARICDMQGVVICDGAAQNSNKSSLSGSAGTAEAEPWVSIISPTINLSASGTSQNNMGLTGTGAPNTDVEATDDYYVDYELYTGWNALLTTGQEWRFAFQSYPAGNARNGTGEHKRWGDLRFPG